MLLSLLANTSELSTAPPYKINPFITLVSLFFLYGGPHPFEDHTYIEIAGRQKTGVQKTYCPISVVLFMSS